MKFNLKNFGKIKGCMFGQAIVEVFGLGTNSKEGIFGKREMSLVDTTFSLLSVGKNAGDWEKIEGKDVFQILPDDDYIMQFENEDKQPIVGIIGTSYMLRNKWILDFHHGLMYAS